MADDKGSVQHLRDQAALNKIREMIKHENTCMFTTHLTQTPLQSRPMATLEVDDEGNLWFFSAVDSDKNIDLSQDSRVQLFYANSGNSEYLSLFGHGEVSQDRKKIDELWTPIAKAWFDDKDDPRLSVVKVVPEQGYYWDTKHNKTISLLKIAAAAVTGKSGDDGVKGKISV